MTVTVSMPHWRTPDTLHRAVRSVLDQTHRDLRLIVINDGDDPATAWKPLSRIRDKRLIRLDLEENRGRYYADAVVLAACDTEWMMIHDTDDYSDRSHVKALLAASEGKDVVFGGYQRHKLSGDVILKPAITDPPAGRLRHQIHPAAILWNTDALHRIGGFHPDWRIAYDTLMAAIAITRLNWVAVDDNGYHQVHRRESLSQSRQTGIRSTRRRDAWAKRQHLWERLKRVDVDQFPAILAPTPDTTAAVELDAKRLRELL